MPRQPNDAARATLYRLLNVGDLLDGVRSKYRENDAFPAELTTVDGRNALLVQGAMVSDRTKWAARLASLASTAVDLGNSTAAAALLIDGTDSDVWALTFGMGFHLLDPDKIDQRFGIRVAVRTAVPESLQSLTRTMLDHRSRTDRSSIPTGDAIRGFGIGDFGEIVSRLAGSAQIDGLTVGSSAVTIRGSDSLNLPLGRQPGQLVSDLDVLADVLQMAPRAELEVVENLVVVKGSRATELDALLASRIEGGSSGALAIGWPHEQLDSTGTPASFKITGNGRRGAPTDGLPSVDNVLDAVRDHHGTVLESLNGIKIQVFADSDGEEPITTQLAARRWLVYEVDHDGIRYCLFNGAWYALDEGYNQRVTAHVAEIFKRPCPVQLPEWILSECPNEAAYNIAASNDLGAVCLDRDLIRTSQHPRGFEACDLITETGDLIHVKHLPASSAASHLIAQAQVSIEALMHDNEARSELRERVVARGGEAGWIPDRPRSFVLALARTRAVDATNLFTFSQVTLARLDSAVRGAGGVLTIASVLRR